MNCTCISGCSSMKMSFYFLFCRTLLSISRVWVIKRWFALKSAGKRSATYVGQCFSCHLRGMFEECRLFQLGPAQPALPMIQPAHTRDALREGNYYLRCSNFSKHKHRPPTSPSHWHHLTLRYFPCVFWRMMGPHCYASARWIINLYHMPSQFADGTKLFWWI